MRTLTIEQRMHRLLDRVHTHFGVAVPLSSSQESMLREILVEIDDLDRKIETNRAETSQVATTVEYQIRRMTKSLLAMKEQLEKGRGDDGRAG